MESLKVEKGCSCKAVSIGDINLQNCDSFRISNEDHMSRIITCIDNLEISDGHITISFILNNEIIIGDGLYFDPVVEIMIDDDVIDERVVRLYQNNSVSRSFKYPTRVGDKSVGVRIRRSKSFNPNNTVTIIRQGFDERYRQGGN